MNISGSRLIGWRGTGGDKSKCDTIQGLLQNVYNNNLNIEDLWASKILGIEGMAQTQAECDDHSPALFAIGHKLSNATIVASGRRRRKRTR